MRRYGDGRRDGASEHCEASILLHFASTGMRIPRHVTVTLGRVTESLSLQTHHEESHDVRKDNALR